MTNYIRPKVIELDNYFVDRHRTPRDESGDFDYESLYALDLEQFNADLADLIAGREVKMPTYNFATGEREYRGNTLQLADNEILLIEGIHGLNPELTKQIPENLKFRLYVSALTTLSIDDHNWVSTTDTRLLRRIIRDAKYRGATALDTIARWPSVRRGESKWIFPYQENANATFNSSLLFELAVIRRHAEPLLRQVPNNTPEYAEASRLLRFLRSSCSVCISRALVASSSSRTEPFRKRARAMAIRCAWPSLSPAPSSPQMASSPSGRSMTKPAQAVLRASRMSASVASGLPSKRLSRMVPLKSVLPCGT